MTMICCQCSAVYDYDCVCAGRFDVVEQLIKSTGLQERPLPSALDHLTLLSWNAGVARQRLDPGAISSGSLHFGMMQEVDPQIVESLERWGAIVHVHYTAQSGLGPATCTFARAAFIKVSKQLAADITLRSSGWLLSYSIARYEFKFPIAGRREVTIASAHLCNEWAKKRDVATEALVALFDKCVTHNVDIIGCDLNQAVALRKSHTTSQLFEAMSQFCRKHGVTSDYPYVTMYGQNPHDCCGFIIMPTSSIYAQCVVDKHGWAPFVNCDLGLRKTDGDSHYPTHMWLRRKTDKRSYLRGEEGWNKIQTKKQKKLEELKAKKKAQRREAL